MYCITKNGHITDIRRIDYERAVVALVDLQLKEYNEDKTINKYDIIEEKQNKKEEK